MQGRFVECLRPHKGEGRTGSAALLLAVLQRWGIRMKHFNKVKLNAGTMRNQCPSCGELFNSVHSFEKHRVGRYGIPDPKKEGDYLPANRRCLTAEEMIKEGMLKNTEGFWISAAYEYA